MTSEHSYETDEWSIVVYLVIKLRAAPLGSPTIAYGVLILQNSIHAKEDLILSVPNVSYKLIRCEI
jgi:hypothetical protein